MMDQIIALTAELESVNITDDNKIHEKLFESQQECNKLQNTISTLQSELMRYYIMNYFHHFNPLILSQPTANLNYLPVISHILESSCAALYANNKKVKISL